MSADRKSEYLSKQMKPIHVACRIHDSLEKFLNVLRQVLQYDTYVQHVHYLAVQTDRAYLRIIYRYCT